MKKFWLIIIITVCYLNTAVCQSSSRNSDASDKHVDKTIFVYGDGLNKTFIKYIISLTGKKNPRISFFPTAAADDERAIGYWYKICSGLRLTPEVIKSFISSSPDQNTFEEEILNSDAIIVGGGNTLNMLAIWKAQGIDTLLRKAYEKGIILAGGSTGSLCWFTGGYSDSRPQKLSIIDCLGFLDYSHSPHYNSEKARKPLYEQAILTGQLKSGYACDDDAGLLFINGKLAKALSLNSTNHSYFVSIKDGKLSEEMLPDEIIK
ncbi:MAG TPA: peptidase E [Bacteroidales bacterium]|nr:peptidase E [Bacteroidales bacterium]